MTHTTEPMTLAQALALIEYMKDQHTMTSTICHVDQAQLDAIRNAIDAELAKQREAEPVAWMHTVTQDGIETDYALSSSPRSFPLDTELGFKSLGKVPLFTFFPEAKTPIDDLVNRFSEALREKLRAAEEKYGYNNGWLRGDWREQLIECLYQHAAKGDPRDVAAYCAFAWHHNWSLTHHQQRNAVEVTDEMVIAATKSMYGDNGAWAKEPMRAALEAALSAVASRDREDAERYRKVKTLSREQFLLWRGAFGLSDKALDDIAAARRENKP